MSTDLKRFRAQYERLRPTIPTFEGEREWPDRLRSWPDFVKFGALVAEDLRRADEWFPEEPVRLRAMAPALADLVMRVFPEK